MVDENTAKIIGEVAPILMLLTGFAIWLIKWVIKKRAGQKEDSAEDEKAISESENLDSVTMKNFLEIMNGLQDGYKELFDENVLLSREQRKNTNKIAELDEKYQHSLDQNLILTKQAEETEKTIETLKNIVVAEQLDKQRLKTGIKVLIEQMKAAQIEPKFEL